MEALAEQAQTLDVVALEQALQAAGIRPGNGWQGYERAKALAQVAARNNAEVVYGSRFLGGKRTGRLHLHAEVPARDHA